MQIIVKAFRKAPLQYACIRDYQLQYYKRHQSLVLSVITRWGTQYRLIQSVLKNKDALRCYAHDYGDLPAKKRIKLPVIKIIREKDTFWPELALLGELLFKLDEALKMSESGKSHLGHVLSRWLDILEHLKRKKVDFPDELELFLSTANGPFSQRYQRQIKPIHVAAFYLLPETRNRPLPENLDSQLQSFFHRYTTSEADYRTIIFEFESFRAQESPFEYGRRCWSLVEHPKLFWHSTMSHTTFLGKLGYRLYCTPVNSVASERAFSAQNLIHTKTRNALQSERVNRLIYLRTNAPIVSQFAENKLEFFGELKGKRPNDLSVKEEVVLENLLLEDKEDRTIIITGISTGDEDEEDYEDEEDESSDGSSNCD